MCGFASQHRFGRERISAHRYRKQSPSNSPSIRRWFVHFYLSCQCWRVKRETKPSRRWVAAQLALPQPLEPEIHPLKINSHISRLRLQLANFSKANFRMRFSRLCRFVRSSSTHTRLVLSTGRWCKRSTSHLCRLKIKWCAPVSSVCCGAAFSPI